MIEVVIGKIAPNPDMETEGEGLWKFIFAEVDGKLELYAGRMKLDGSKYKHENVAEENKIPKTRVRGGGLMHVHDSLVKLTDYSIEFGIVPNCALECVARDLLNALKDYRVARAQIEMHYQKGAERHHPFNFERWISYGFEFDLNPRDITF